MWSEILGLCMDYSGNGLAVGLFFLSFVYLMLAEKEKWKRMILLYTTLVTMLLFLCPIFAKVIYGLMDEEIYYRILWLIPMTIVIAYAGIHVIGRLPKTWMKILGAVAGCVVIIVTGDYVYDNPFFSVANNRFHVPQTVADVCDDMIIEGREVRAVVPSEMLAYVRQYTANICMPYGRDLMVETWITDNPLYDAMLERPVNCEKIAGLAIEQSCHYVVLHETTEQEGSFEEHGFHLKNTVDGYRIYLRDDAGF